MKKEDVIKIATGLRTDFKCESDTMVDFCNTIIKALEQERSRSAEITQYRHDCEKLMEENERLKKALEQQPCEVPSYEMTLEQARQAVRDLRKFVMDNHILPKLQPCEDAISRKAFDEALYEHFHDEDAPNNITEITLGSVRNFLKDFPSVAPIRKKGKWIWKEDWTPSTPVNPAECNYAGWVCSECGEFPDEYAEWDNPDEKPTYKYCHNCGAEMESEG